MGENSGLTEQAWHDLYASLRRQDGPPLLLVATQRVRRNERLGVRPTARSRPTPAFGRLLSAPYALIVIVTALALVVFGRAASLMGLALPAFMLGVGALLLLAFMSCIGVAVVSGRAIMRVQAMQVQLDRQPVE